jgi:hypothetical protein
VEKTGYACGEAPATPPATVTRTGAELPGTTCPAGGTRVEAGPDVDGDGTLDDLEVRTSSIVCGVGPVRTRARTAWLEECGASGVIVESGLDADVDGVLEDGEVAASARQCTDTVWLRYPVSTAEDVALLQGVKRVAGSLVVKGSALESMFLWLEVVDGGVYVQQNPGLKTFSLTVGLLGGGIEISGNPVLERAWITPRFLEGYGGLRVQGDVVVDGNPKLLEPLGSGDLGSVAGSLVLRNNDVLQLWSSLERLRFVGGSVAIERNASLDGLSMPELEWVLGWFTLDGNPELEDTRSISDGLLLTHVGGRLVVKNNAKLANAYFLRTRSVGGIELSNNAPGTYLWLPEVSTVQGDVLVSGTAGWVALASGVPLTIDGSLVVTGTPLTGFSWWNLETVWGNLQISRNANLVNPAFPALRRVGGDLGLSENAALAAIPSQLYQTFGALETAGSLTVSNNPLLAKLALPALRRVGSWVMVYDNPTLPACQVRDLVAGLAYAPTSTPYINGNDDVATCP